MIEYVAFIVIVALIMAAIFMRKKTKKIVEDYLWDSHRVKINVIQTDRFKTRMSDFEKSLGQLESAIVHRQKVMKDMRGEKNAGGSGRDNKKA